MGAFGRRNPLFAVLIGPGFQRGIDIENAIVMAPVDDRQGIHPGGQIDAQITGFQIGAQSGRQIIRGVRDRRR